MCAGKSVEMVVLLRKMVTPGWVRVLIWKVRGGMGKVGAVGAAAAGLMGLAGLATIGRGVAEGSEVVVGSWGTVMVAVVVVVVVSEAG
jgi:hypothetical protein